MERPGHQCQLADSIISVQQDQGDELSYKMSSQTAVPSVLACSRSAQLHEECSGTSVKFQDTISKYSNFCCFYQFPAHSPEVWKRACIG